MPDHECVESRQTTEEKSREEMTDTGGGVLRRIKICWTLYRTYCHCGKILGSWDGPERWDC